MESLGTIFKQIRETNNISLEEIEEATKIRVKYLQAIEEDNYAALPGKVYAKGFVKSYARFFKIDQEPVILEMIEETFGDNTSVNNTAAPAANADPPQETLKRQNKQKTAKTSLLEKIPAKEKPIEDKPLNKKISRIIGISALFIVLLLAVGGIYSLFSQDAEPPADTPPIVENNDQKEPNDAQNNTDSNTNSATIPNNPTLPVKQEYDGLNMTITLVDVQPGTVDKCWLQVIADGKILWEETLNEGASKTVTAKESIKVKAGNAGVVKITLNDQDLGIMGSYSQVVTKEYTLDSLNKDSVVYSPGASEPISGGIYDEQPTEVSNEDPNALNTPQ